MHEVEQELIDVSGFVPERDYKDRQDYLAALVVHVAMNVDEDGLEGLTDAAYDWAKAASKARKANKQIKDFNGEAHEAEADDSSPVQEVDTETPEAPKEKKPRKQKPLKPGKPTGELDVFGIAVGTKSHVAAGMFAAGTTMKDVKDAIGSTYYNLLNRLEKEGFKIERNGSYIKLYPKS
jgi:hypothetical protein